VILAGAGVVFAEGGVENSVEAVLDDPMSSDGLGEGRCGEAGGGEMVAGRRRGPAVAFDGRDDPADGGSAISLRAGQQPNGRNT